jgi:hypothetical protein
MISRPLVGLWATCVALTICHLNASAAADIVLYASDAVRIQGNWARVADQTAAGGVVLASADFGWSTTSAPLASPADYVEFAISAPAATPYHLWIRLRAAGNSKWNDSLWVQFSDAQTASGTPVDRIGTTDGVLVNLENCSGCGLSSWGWQDRAWWLAPSAIVQFASAGSHTLRLQTREDGVQIDQVILSPATYMSAAPGAVSNDATIVPKPAPTAPAASASTPFAGTPWPIPGAIQSEDFDEGGEGVAYHDSTPGNAGGRYRSTDVDVTAGSDGGYIVGWVPSGEWLNYSVDVAAAGIYAVGFRVAALGQGGTFHLEMNGTDVTGSLTVPNTGDWQAFQIVSTTVALSAGRQMARLVMDAIGTYSVGNFDSMQFTGPVASPIATTGAPDAPNTPNPPDGTVGVTTTPNLSWKSAAARSYQVRLGTSNPPPIVVQSTSDFWFGTSLGAGTQYYWQIVATNASGSTTGPVWSFVTAGSGSGTASPAPAPTPAPAAATVSVPGGGDLQAAIDNAQPGTTILLQAGALYVGNFTLPVKSGASMITIRSSASDASLPGPTTRVGPGDAPQLAALQSPNSAPVISTAAGAHHYTLMGLELRANAQGLGDILDLGDGSSAQSSLDLVPHDLVVDRCYVHGDPSFGQKRGIGLNSAATTIANSYIADIKSASQDSQAISGWNGPGPYTISNNYLEAAGENVIFGGADPAIPNLIPTGITIRGNTIAKPFAWRGSSWIVKNLFELKNAQQVVVDGNTLENIWTAAQMGFAVQLTPRNQDGNCGWCVIQQIRFTNNIVRHASSGINLLGTDDVNPSGVANAILIQNNLFEDLSASSYGGYGRFLQIGAGPVNVTVDHNTVLQDGTSAVYAYGRQTTGFVFTNNIVPDNSWAVMGDGASPGNGTIAAYFPSSTFADGIFAGSNPASYPAGNYYPASMSAVGFVDLAGGNYRLSTASAYLTAATDGTAVGCNIDAVDGATGARY